MGGSFSAPIMTYAPSPCASPYASPCASPCASPPVPSSPLPSYRCISPSPREASPCYASPLRNASPSRDASPPRGQSPQRGLLSSQGEGYASDMFGVRACLTRGRPAESLLMTVIRAEDPQGPLGRQLLVEVQYIGSTARTSASGCISGGANWNETIGPFPLAPGRRMVCCLIDGAGLSAVDSSQGKAETVIGVSRPFSLEALPRDARGCWTGPVDFWGGNGSQLPSARVWISFELAELSGQPALPQPCLAPFAAPHLRAPSPATVTAARAQSPVYLRSLAPTPRSQVLSSPRASSPVAMRMASMPRVLPPASMLLAPMLPSSPPGRNAPSAGPLTPDALTAHMASPPAPNGPSRPCPAEMAPESQRSRTRGLVSSLPASASAPSGSSRPCPAVVDEGPQDPSQTFGLVPSLAESALDGMIKKKPPPPPKRQAGDWLNRLLDEWGAA